jgi:hypothetical protein
LLLLLQQPNFVVGRSQLSCEPSSFNLHHLELCLEQLDCKFGLFEVLVGRVELGS